MDLGIVTIGIETSLMALIKTPLGYVTGRLAYIIIEGGLQTAWNRVLLPSDRLDHFADCRV